MWVRFCSKFKSARKKEELPYKGERIYAEQIPILGADQMFDLYGIERLW
ncbi:MAG: hypothetical protein KME40_05385 [Komarekiella atlantica HA4396-MV6]|jgi:hypothetical protein|nr:hypothetical protein [Komarekiella atlantica HA4396-MV6]